MTSLNKVLYFYDTKTLYGYIMQQDQTLNWMVIGNLNILYKGLKTNLFVCTQNQKFLYTKQKFLSHYILRIQEGEGDDASDVC